MVRATAVTVGFVFPARTAALQRIAAHMMVLRVTLRHAMPRLLAYCPCYATLLEVSHPFPTVFRPFTTARLCRS